MGTPGTETAATGDREQNDAAPGLVTLCVGCGRPLASVLQQLGSLRCHDCREGECIDSFGESASGR
jgi:hypothetical protein